MSSLQLFSEEKKRQLQELVLNLNHDQLLWLDGYVSGVQDRSQNAPAISVVSPVLEDTNISSTKTLKVLYGSHSGNGKKVASLVLAEAQRLGIPCEVIDMNAYNIRKLKDEEQLLVIVSTHGEGEPPVAAEELYHYLSGKKAPKLDGLSFSVIALSDNAYKKYCQTGIDFYDFLKKQNAKPVDDIIKLDVDFNEKLGKLIPSLVAKFNSQPAQNINTGSASISALPQISSDVVVEVPVFERIQLNGKGSEKETWHIEVSTEDSGLKYEPGDALEIYPTNNIQLVSDIISQLNLSPSENVVVNNQKMTLTEALMHHFELTVVTPQVFKKYVTNFVNSKISGLLNDADQLEQFLYSTDVLDLLKTFPATVSASELVTILRKLPSRLYSIASSQESVGEEVHITVGAVRYEKDNRKRGGVCSTFLADRLGDDEKLKVKIRPNDQFRLPKSHETPVIMIGAGTGIAPFRAFIQHREAVGAKGKNWLVFGDQHFTTDFLYQTEWLKYRKDGLLTKLDVAFSRDQKDKVYVQNRLAENSSELYKWLSEGAHLYVCGDMKKMAKDVKSTLLSIIEKEGKLSTDDASDYLRQLKKEGRYQEDVY